MVSSLSDIPLSVLDTSPIVEGSTAREALGKTQDLARLVDRLGYHRYWVPEHHSMRGVASAAPAVVVAQLAAVTTHIRVGSGGVMLYNHAPIVVAEQFGTLEAFHPGRIDLGLGRALGGSMRAAAVVRSEAERTARSYREQLEELLGYFTSLPEQAVRAIPAVGNTPPVWLLGSTDSSAVLAAELGLPYAFAHHLRPDCADSALRRYRESFQSSATVAEPYVLVSVSAVVADTDDHAEWLAGSNKLKVLSRSLGRPILLPSPEEAARYPYTDEDLAVIEGKFASVVIGSPQTADKALRGVLEHTAADELMITTQVFEHAARLRSYELLADLTGRAGGARGPAAPWETRSHD